MRQTRVLLILMLFLLGAESYVTALDFPGGLTPPKGVPKQEEPPALEDEFYTRIDGDKVYGILILRVPAHWKLFHTDVGPEGAYDLPLELKFDAPGVVWEKPVIPKPIRIEDAKLDPDPAKAWRYVHKGRIVITIEGKWNPAGAQPQPNEIKAIINGQICSDNGQCVMIDQEQVSQGAGDDALFAAFNKIEPEKKPEVKAKPQPVPAPLKEDSPDPAPAPLGQAPAAATQAAAPSSPRDAVGESAAPTTDAENTTGFTVKGQANYSLAIMMLFAFAAGILLNFTPCVLPMISIRVLGLVQQAGEGHHRRAFTLGLVFAGGVLSVFLVLGGIAAGFQQGWGEQFQSQTFVIVLVSVIFAFALSLFGVFEIFVPQGVNQLAAGAPRTGAASTYFMGVLATLMATPCAGPLVGSTLAWALKQHWFVILSIFVLMGIGMASPYIILTAHPVFMKIVPKPGAWMDTFKKAIGFLLLGATVYLMRSLPMDMILYIMGYFVFIALACWIWGHWGSPIRKRKSRIISGFFTLLILSGGWWVCLHYLYTPMPTETPSLTDTPNTTYQGWQTFSPELMNKAREAGRPVLIKWTADWCTNCKINDRLVFKTEVVETAMIKADMLLLRADITRKNPQTQELKAFMRQLGGSAIPYVVVIMPDGKTVEPFPDLINKTKFLEFLEKLIQQKKP